MFSLSGGGSTCKGPEVGIKVVFARDRKKAVWPELHMEAD